MKQTLMIVIASTRPGRAGLPVAEWFSGQAHEDGRFELDVADLAELDLPLLDEPNHPRLAKYEHRHTKDWSARVERADAFVFVMPEYNYGLTAPLKNAIDYLNREWHYKPVGFVGYGGVAAGARAVQMAKQVVTTLRMVPLFEAVYIPFVGQLIDDEGAFAANTVMEEAATAMLAELERVAAALRPLRSEGENEGDSAEGTEPLAEVKLVDFESVEEEFFERWDIVGHQINRHIGNRALTGTPDSVADVIEFPPGFVHRMHRHPHADQLLLPLSGSVRFSDPSGKTLDVGPGQLLTIPRHNWHEVRNESEQVCRVFHVFAGVGDIAEIGYEAFDENDKQRSV